MSEAPYADDLPYWKTSRSGPDKWSDKAALEIERAGGEIISEGFGREHGRAAFMLRFALEGDTFRLVWPVLKSKRDGEERAAKVQAATMMYHDVKACCVKARALGARTAFFAHMEMPDGRVAAELAAVDLAQFPLALRPAAEIVDGEFDEASE